MRIISSEDKFIGKIACECNTVFEFEASDVLTKGNYQTNFYISCPVCELEHDYTESMTEQNRTEVEEYLDSCKSCADCKYMSVVEDGYSSYTITDIDISCRLNLNKNLHLSGTEDVNKKRSIYAFAQKCSAYKQGARYYKEVEQSQSEAENDWNQANSE